MKKVKIDSIVVFDGTSYFVEEVSYILGDDEEIVFHGDFDSATEECDNLNDACTDKPRTAYM